MATRFGISRTRFFQDIAALDESGLSVACDARGYRCLAEGAALPVPLTTTEVMAVLLPGETVGDGLVAHARAARSKLAAILPPQFRSLFGERAARVRMEAQATPASVGPFHPSRRLCDGAPSPSAYHGPPAP